MDESCGRDAASHHLPLPSAGLTVRFNACRPQEKSGGVRLSRQQFPRRRCRSGCAPSDKVVGDDGSQRDWKSRPFKAKSLDRFPAEEIDQLDDENDDHHQLEYEGAALIELVHHEAVELFGGFQFLLDEIFVIGHSDF
jgi:hypothetical protein